MNRARPFGDGKTPRTEKLGVLGPTADPEWKGLPARKAQLVEQEAFPSGDLGETKPKRQEGDVLSAGREQSESVVVSASKQTTQTRRNSPLRRLRRRLKRVFVRARPAVTNSLSERADWPALNILLSEYFDAEWYRAKYPDVSIWGADPYQHFVHHGAAELRDPCAEFDSNDYEANNPEVRRFESRLLAFWKK